MDEHDQLTSEIFRLLIYVKRDSVLRFIRRMVWNALVKEGINPDAILHSED